MISDEEKDQVRAASDLVAIVQETVELKPRGHEFWGCCPFHGEKTPSFHIIPATQVWHCFGCGEGGDVFTYIMKRENLSFPDSIRYLADRAGIELHDTGAQRDRGTKRARIYDLCAETAQFYHTMLCAVRTAVRASTLPAAVWVAMSADATAWVLRLVARAGFAPVSGGLYPAGDDRRQRGRKPWARTARGPLLRPCDVSHL